ncbi:hypothetical protein Back11_63390 [Paenibacillus baekrokdamisoli]|uniref:Copper amine oxidase-like N-terminal domain-containing protein n=1 Tax=Paenibacillus baekrokdamisoli TaxID=1712516 RepID=A0A3G9JQ95_9BACL|nr:copper amine oxidase N-terminal domain-containing protein [Paenibacillus baekrokdamisoli]MBB3069432.1 hypothetical protein [Paenibacillus baekrokdamisoli]BBH24994.1 hypothetical protein Back11_63390 [Paenibacillus baekrokdamisoli]
MKKRMISTITAAAVLLTSFALVQHKATASPLPKIVSSDMPIAVLYNARKISSDVSPKMIDGTVLVPIRFVAEKLKATIDLKGKDITVKKGTKTIKLTIGSKAAVINGKSTTLLQAAMVEKGRTLVPLRVISEGLAVKVEWDAVTRFVWIGNKDIPELKDVAPKTKDIKDYMNYFKGNEGELQFEGRNKTTATIIANDLFPFQVDGRVFYRLDLAKSDKGNIYIKVVTTDKGIMVTPLFFLGPDNLYRTRNSPAYLRETVGSIRLNYYPVDARDSYKINMAKYVGLYLSYDSLVLMNNPWR